jgi:primosomal protein N' (replication factor Y)
MGSVGLGVNSIARILAQHFPDAIIATLSKDQPQFRKESQITICTSQLFFQPPSVHFDLLATIHIDQILHGTSWRTNEEAYLVLSRLAERAEQFVVQSSQPDHPVLQAFCSDSVETLYANEAILRKTAGYPPYGTFTQLIFAGADEAKVKKEVDRLYLLIQEALPQVKDKLHEPSPVGSGKRRGRYRYQIIARSPLTPELTALIPPGWQIDPAPEAL